MKKCNPWNPWFWLTGHCYHHVRSKRRPILCHNGKQIFEFPQVASYYNLNQCCVCGHERWIEDDGGW